MSTPRIPIRPDRILALALALAGLLGAACGDAGAQPAPVPAPKVAFFEDLSVPDTLDTVLPASLSMQAYLRAQTDAGRAAPFQLVAFDTGGVAATALKDAREVSKDPTYVAVVAAPFWIEPPSVADALSMAGIPVLNLSAAGTTPGAGSGGWVSLVASLDAQAKALAALASGEAGPGPVCEGGDGTTWSQLLARAVAGAAPSMRRATLPPDATAAADTVEQRECRVVMWTGFSPVAAQLRASLPPSVVIAGADGMMTWSYLATAPEGAPSIVACSCADVNTSTDPAAQTFINGDQVATGLTPGVFAAEAWDAGGILEGLLRGSRSRASVRAGLGRLNTYRGVAATYRFEPPMPLAAREYRGIGSRWIPGSRP